MITIAGRKWNPDCERLLADGAWGTEFMKRGLEQGDAPERMNIKNPDTVHQVALEYLKAGSDIILTNSFSGNRCLLERHGLAEKTGEINRKAAEISAAAAAEFADAFSAAQDTGQAQIGGAAGRRGAPDPGATTRFFDRPLVAGSMGPTGKMVVMGEIGTDELLGVFSQQAESLAAGGADLLLIETMNDMEEVRIAVRAAAKTGLPVISSVSYDKAPAGYRTMMGNSPEDCIEAALSEGASVIGANCGTGIENYMNLAKELCSIANAPVWIKANAGLPELVDKEMVYRQSAEEYASFIPKLLDTGVSVVGGCCGTTPAFVAAMRKQLDTWLAAG